MSGRTCGWMLAISLVICGSLAIGEEKELVRNPGLAPAGNDAVPGEWSLWSPPVTTAACRVQATAKGLVVDAPQRPYAVGGVSQDLRGVQPGTAYSFNVVCAAEKIPSPVQSLLVRLIWTQKGKPLSPSGMLVRGPQLNGDRLNFHDVLVVPKEADGARLSLELKWPQGGSVRWQQVSMRPTASPPPRRAKVGTVYLRPRNSTPERNMQLFCDQIDAAGRLGLDILCLPEAILAVGTPHSGPQTAEPIPGKSTERLGQAARKNRLWVVAGLYERDGDQVFNAAVLLDRQGRMAGKYRKIHLPREEWQLGVTPGHDYPVFQTEFGTVAMQICYDWFFPEAGAAFSLRGAEIIFAPTWGTTYPDKDGRVEGENAFRVRARDQGVYLVPSVYDGSSMVIDPMGRILASSKGREGVFWHEIDLNDRECLEWVGHWRSIGPRDRMPSTYGPLMELK